jgi:hypothetical protein
LVHVLVFAASRIIAGLFRARMFELSNSRRL